MEFTDFTLALVVSERMCPNDWDHSGGVPSEDFFAFLNEFLVESADFNRDGFANSQDFFEFLTAFFAEC